MFLFLKTYKKYAKSIKKRLLDYWAKLYRTNIKKGKQYGDLRKTIVILIANFELEQLKSKKLYQTRWKIMEEKLKIELTDLLEIDIIELPKVKRALENKRFKGFGRMDELFYQSKFGGKSNGRFR